MLLDTVENRNYWSVSKTAWNINTIFYPFQFFCLVSILGLLRECKFILYFEYFFISLDSRLHGLIYKGPLLAIPAPYFYLVVNMVSIPLLSNRARFTSSFWHNSLLGYFPQSSLFQNVNSQISLRCHCTFKKYISKRNMEIGLPWDFYESFWINLHVSVNWINFHIKSPVFRITRITYRKEPFIQFYVQYI